MRPVWKALEKRFEDPSDVLWFFEACQLGILGWRESSKLTASEHRALYDEIDAATARLIRVIEKANLNDYRLGRLFKDIHVERIAAAAGLKSAGPDEDGIDRDLDRVGITLQRIAPSILEVLRDFADYALWSGESEIPLVKKPNSANAELHHFVRHLSMYCKETYNQPLHDVVASTTSVVFDADIDADYVRKLVKGIGTPDVFIKI